MVAAQLPAQEASVILGGVHTRYADTASGSAGQVGARLGYWSRSFSGAAGAYYTRFTTGEWATQVSGGVVALHELGRSAAIGIRGDGTYSYLEGDFWSGIAGAGPTVGFAGRNWLLGISGTAGALRTIYETSDPLFTGSARLTWILRSWSVDAQATTTWADQVRYADFLLGTSVNTRAFTASLVAGIRAGDLADQPWIQGRAEWRIANGVAFEAAIGNYPEDITGFLGGFFVNAGLRLGRLAPVAVSRPRSPVRMEYLSDTEVRVTFSVSGASAVAIAGEWNQWTPIPLSHISGDSWQVILPLGDGVYHFSLVVDEAWVVPEGFAALPDDFGGEVGLLVVSRR
jgi:hypothetical protein